MKRRLLKLCVFLVLGAIVNVGVAWFIAIECPRPKAEALDYQAIRWLYAAPPGWPDADRRWVCSSRWMQFTILQAWHTKPGRSDRDLRIIDKTYRQMGIAFGYPLRSLSMFAEYDEPKWTWHGSWHIPVHNQSDAARMIPVKGLPLVPTFPGFAINTLFYAAICWLLLASPFAVRRHLRVRRNLCPHCAYPIGTSDVCTECGRLVRGKKAVSPA
jgi:hypothetical protein